jgi:hypothetical protein
MADVGKHALVNQGLADRQNVPYFIAFYLCPCVDVRAVYKTSVLQVRITHFSDFGLRISFGFRISVFGFYPCSSVFIRG